MKLRTRPKTETEEDLVALPCKYRGVSLRSRLECRWIIWMDALGIAWEYEPRAVRVGGRPRWTDLWLPREEVWLEIKPEGVPPDEHLALALAEETGSPLLWLAGRPWPGDYTLTFFPRADLPPIKNLRWALGRRDHSEVWVCDPGAVLSLRLSPQLAGPLDWEAARALEFPLFHCETLRQAYLAATTYRFDCAP